MKDAGFSYGCLLVSVAVHGLAVLGNAAPARPSPRPRLTMLELAPLAPPAPPPPRPAPPPRAPSEPRARASPPIPRKIRAEPPPREPSPDPPATPPEPEPELTGRTITAAGDARWAAPVGNGAERGPTLGVAAAPPRLASTLVTRNAAPPSVVVAPFAALSRKPAPPSLTAMLERNYPAAARRQGQSGEAKVRALIDAHGRATSVTVISESSPGFGAGCQRTLLQSQWTPPLGPHGEPTGTFVSYRCRFQVSD